MDQVTWESLLATRKKAEEYINGRMVAATKENGLTENSMVSDVTPISEVS